MSLHAIADGWWRFAGDGIYHGTLLALVTFAVTATLLRRARPALLVAIWTIVLVKFVLPIGPELRFSLDGLADHLLGGSATEQSAAAGDTAPAAVAAAPAPADAPDRPWLPPAAFALYGVAVAGLAGRRLRDHWRQRRRIVALPAARTELVDAVHRAAGLLGVRRLPAVRESPRPCSPQLFGVLSPVLVVPTWIIDQPGRLEAALLHELAHLRRRDTWLRCGQVAVGTLLFFWPVVAWVNRRIDCAREMACDEWAIRRGALRRTAYARLLVAMAQNARRGAASPPAAALALSWPPSQLARRVDFLLAARRRPAAPGVLAVGAVTLWGTVSLSSAATAEPAVDRAQLQCLRELRDLEPDLAARLFAAYPEADRDGDGVLTRFEICAHQQRLKRQLVDQAFDEMSPTIARDVAGWLDPAVDRDGDGELSSAELDTLKDEVASTMSWADLEQEVEFPENICEEPPVPCPETR